MTLLALIVCSVGTGVFLAWALSPYLDALYAIYEFKQLHIKSNTVRMIVANLSQQKDCLSKELREDLNNLEMWITKHIEN